MGNKRIIVLGGGFGGVYTAMHLEKLIKNDPEWEIVLVNKENYFVYQPMLAEVVGGSVGLLDTVSAIRRLCPKTRLFVRDIETIDTKAKKVILTPKFTHKAYELSYDHLIFAFGTVTDFRGIPGLHEHALPFKTLADSVVIRNRVIEAVESAAAEEDPEMRRKLLTFVIGGGGFSGVEVAAELNDFARRLVKDYPEIDPNLVRVVLVHSKDRLMDKEMPESLSRFAGKIMQKRGVEIIFNMHLKTATPYEAILENGERIPSFMVISTVPSSPNPLIEALEGLPQEKGKLKTDLTMQVEGSDHLWAVGDCAWIPNPSGEGRCPPTAQFALREGKTLAHNIWATVQGKQKKNFSFKVLGMLGALGHHCAVAELFGKFRFSGVLAWLLWRAIYWMKLPGIDRKIKVAVSWFIDMIIPIESVQLKLTPAHGMARLHYETGENIFQEGDVGDYLYIVVKGEVDVIRKSDHEEKTVATLKEGEYFGEMALLNEKQRNATVRCKTPVDVLALKKQDFGALMANFGDLRKNFEETEKKRRAS